jgi:hypothetical protein
MDNSSFDFSAFCEEAYLLPVTKIEEKKIELSGSAASVAREKLEKKLFGKKKDYYACRFEKALITIAEKNNGEY